MRSFVTKRLALVVALLGVPVVGAAQSDAVNQDNTPYGTTSAEFLLLGAGARGTALGGAFASIDCGWSRPATYPTWGGVTMHVVGERGTVDVDVFRQALTHYDDQSGVTKLVGWGDDLNGLMVGGFVDAILAGQAVPISGEDGLRSLEVVVAAYRSAELGRPVAISEVA